MKPDKRIFLHLAAAALVLLSAAVCATAQSRPAKRSRPDATSAREEPVSPVPAQGEKRTRQPTPAKRNAREQKPVDAATSSKDDATPSTTTADDDAPRYSYEFRQPTFIVSHIHIEHDQRGRGKVTFERQIDPEPLVEPLTLSAAALQRITALWEALRFLETDVSYQSEKQLAHLGTMRLRMTRGKRERTAEFNWTHDRDAFALVNEYRRAADQALLVFEIGVALENQPLEMTRLLNRFDILLERNGLSDPTQLVPLLRELNVDERIPLIARNQAERLLKKIEKQEKQNSQTKGESTSSQ